MSYTYLFINVFIIAIPLALTFDKRTAYFRQIPAVGFATGVVSACYLIWDVLVTARGEWSFNGKYLTGVHLLNIPLEEVLFFITVPYSCLFIYEVVLFATTDRFYKMSTPVLITVIVLLAAASLALRDQGYTSKALASCSFFLTVAYLVGPSAADQPPLLDVVGDLLHPVSAGQFSADRAAGCGVQSYGDIRPARVHDSHRRFFLQLRDVVLLPAVLSPAQKITRAIAGKNVFAAPPLSIVFRLYSIVRR